MYKYRLGLALIKDVKESKRKLCEREFFIRKQINIFNEKSKTSSVNPKYIGLGKECEDGAEDDIVISPSTIILTLYSFQQLNTPGKAMRLLSQLLIQSADADNLADLLSEDKKLFRTFNVAMQGTSDGNKEIISTENVQDADLIKALIDYLLKSKSTYSPELNSQRIAIDKMKILAIESGILLYDTENQTS